MQFVFYILSISCQYCQYPAAVGSIAVLQLLEADKNHPFWLTLQMNYNPKYQIAMKDFVTIWSIKFFHTLLFFVIFQETMCWKTLWVFVCLSIKLQHVSIILNAVNLCVSSNSFCPISQDWLFAPLSLV